MGDEIITALDDVTLDIETGEVCCIFGPSGSGKSTLLNLIAGLEKPSSGSIKVKGMAVSKMNEKKLAKFRQQNVGFVFQSYNLLSTLTAMENVTLPLIFNRVSKKKRNKRAFSMLKSVGLEKRWRHKPSQMSGGQQQRVSIARAFINNPAVVFADEPTGNLDTKTSEEMMKLIIKMAEENNQTLIIVTHDMDTVKYATKIIHIRDGKVESIEIIDASKLKDVVESQQESAADSTAETSPANITENTEGQ